MTEQDRILFRRAILRALDHAHVLKLTPDDLHNGLAGSFQGVTLDTIIGELHDLQEKGFTTREQDKFNGAIIRWGRTEAARELLASLNLAAR